MRRCSTSSRSPIPTTISSVAIERRAALGAAEVNKRFGKAGNYGLLLIDTGFRADDILTPDGVSSLTSLPSRESVRIEAVAQCVDDRGVGAGHGGLM